MSPPLRAQVLWELLTWQLPWSEDGVPWQPFQVMYAILQGERPAIPPRRELPGPDTLAFSGLDAYCQLMRECWAQEPGDRPNMDAIIPRLAALQAAAPNSANRLFPDGEGGSGGDDVLARRGTL